MIVVVPILVGGKLEVEGRLHPEEVSAMDAEDVNPGSFAWRIVVRSS